MKKIKIKICRYDPNDQCSYGYLIVSLLKKHYDIEFSEDPEYLFYNEGDYEHLNYQCIKVFYTGENIHPNFNFCDYAISFDYLDFEDRHYRLPIYLVATFYREKELALSSGHDFTEQKPFSQADLSAKTGFCSFVYSNYLGDGSRKAFFDRLNGYKKVSSGGKYLNNTGSPVDNKLEFETKHKFSIAFENSSRSGYTTEKIVTSLMAKTIPIYWGNPRIHEEFNEGRFVNCHRFASFDEVVARIKEIDNNDELYIKMMNEPIKTNYDFKSILNGFENFLRHIIDQPLEEARRNRINPARAAELEENEKVAARHISKKAATRKVLAKLYQPFKKIKALEKMKQKMFARKIYKK